MRIVSPVVNRTGQPMADLLLKTQSLVQALSGALNSLPWWIAVVLLFAPTLLSLSTRRPVTVLSTALLNMSCLFVLATGQSSIAAVPVAVVTFSAALIFALFGLRERLLWQNLSGIEARMDHMDQEMESFIQALERRSDLLDQRGEETRKALEVARQAFEEARKAPAPPNAAAPSKATFQAALPSFPQGSRTSVSVKAPQNATELERTAAPATFAPTTKP